MAQSLPADKQNAQDAQDAQVSLAELPLTADELDRANRIDFRIDRDSEVPVGTQLGWRLHAMLARGALRPGDRVPSVRELADFAGVNVNTARAVYRELEQEGLISSQQGRGTFVTEKADGLHELGELVGRTLAEARERGLDPKLLAASLYSEPPAASAPLPGPFPEIDRGTGERAMRRALREQIGMLEAELANYAWNDPHGAPPARPRGGGPVGRIVGVEELERTRAELIDRLRRLRGEAAARGAREQAARGHVESMLRDPAGHRWERVDNGTLGEPSCGEYRVVPAWGPVGAIMGWWRVKVSSGCP